MSENKFNSFIYKFSAFVGNDGSEKIGYNLPDFPVLIRKNTLPANLNLASAKSHWHEDIEFISVISGSIRYNVNGSVFTLRPGDGVFINSRQFHYLMSDSGAASSFYCAVLHPMLLCSLRTVEQQYVAPVTEGGEAYILLSSSVPWQAEILDCVRLMYDSTSEEGAELMIQSLYFRLWKTLCTHAVIRRDSSPNRDHKLTMLKNMVAFIHTHYREKISLEDICAAGSVGKTMCTAVFKKCVNCTPVAFLTEYRIKKAVELLQSTDMSVTEIAYETGFSSASYFAECFRKELGSSPREYKTKLSEYRQTL